MSSCQRTYQCYHQEIPLTIHPPPPYVIPSEPVRIALVLGGGGARGMAHVGVLEELEQANISVDLIVGSSAGALIGALYSNYPNAGYLKELLCPLKRDDLIDICWWDFQLGLSKGALLKRFLLEQFGDKEFGELAIPLVVVTTDLHNGELICFNAGPVAPVVHASCAYPFYFTPLHIYQHILVDGGVLDPNPVAIAKQFQPELIVAVDLCSPLPNETPTNLFGVTKRCTEILFLKLSRSCVKEADIIITPDLGDVDMFDDKHTEMLYEAGKTAARAAIPKILAALRSQRDYSAPPQ